MMSFLFQNEIIGHLEKFFNPLFHVLNGNVCLFVVEL